LQTLPEEHALPLQHGCPAAPQLLHEPPEQTSDDGVSQVLFAQHGWLSLPQPLHWPPLHTRLARSQLPPVQQGSRLPPHTVGTHLMNGPPVSQTSPGSHTFPAQQAWPWPPQLEVLQLPVRQTYPATHGGTVEQQASPTLPHAAHVPALQTPAVHAGADSQQLCPTPPHSTQLGPWQRRLASQAGGVSQQGALTAPQGWQSPPEHAKLAPH
jgi:hypothetical protein